MAAVSPSFCLANVESCGLFRGRRSLGDAIVTAIRQPQSSNALRRGLVLSVSAVVLSVAALGVTPAAAQTNTDTAAAPTGANTVQGVVVTGRTGLDQAMLEKRDAVASTEVISAEQIADRPVANVADAVSILPGVSTFADNGLGQATTGNPQFANLRGLAATYDVDELNGVRVAGADPSTRAFSLIDLPPFGVQRLEIDYSITADKDGDNIGGQLNIVTPTAFDFNGPMAKIDLIGTLSGLASSTGFDGKGDGIQIEGANKYFGDRLGVYATAYYQRTISVAETTDVGGYAPTNLADANQSIWNNGTALTANQFRWDFYTHYITTYGGNLALDWRTPNQTFYFKATAAEYDDQGTDTQQSIREQQGPNYTNLNPVSTIPGTTQTTTNYDSNGVYDPNSVFPGHYFQLRDQVQDLDTAKLGGSTIWGRLRADYSVNFSYGLTSQPNYVQGSSYGSVDNSGRFIITSTANGKPTVTYDSPATEAFLYNQSSSALWKFQGADTGSNEALYGGKLDLTYDVGAGLLKNVRAGFEISQSQTQAWNHSFTDQQNNYVILGPGGVIPSYSSPAGPTVANQAGQNVGAFLGYGGLFKVNYRGQYVSAILPVAYKDIFVETPTGLQANPGAYTPNDYNGGSYGGTENIDAFYISGEFAWGDLHIYPGLRYEYTGENLYSWVDQNTSTGNGNGSFQNYNTNYGELLPSLNLVYRPDNGYVVRASLSKSFSRPSLEALAGPATDTYGGNTITDGQASLSAVSQGNPNLKPTQSINFETDFEYYGTKDLYLEANFYAKELSDFIFTANTTGAGLSTQTSTSTVNGIQYSEPENGNTADIIGLTLSATDRFSFLPGLWRGLGVNVNGTFQHSQANTGTAGENNIPLPQAPKIIYNLQALYDLDGVRAALTYQYTGLQLDSTNGSLLNDWIQPTAVLNFSAGYTYKNWNLTFAAKNLTDEYAFYRTLGESTKYLDDQVGGANGNYIMVGRQYQISLSYKY